MNKTEKAPSKVKFIYNKPEDYRTYYANGAFGAITPRGDYEFNFFFEHKDLPEKEVMNIEGDQLKPEEQKNLAEITVIRDFKVGMIMTIEQAEELGKWLLSTIENYKKQLKK